MIFFHYKKDLKMFRFMLAYYKISFFYVLNLLRHVTLTCMNCLSFLALKTGRRIFIISEQTFKSLVSESLFKVNPGTSIITLMYRVIIIIVALSKGRKNKKPLVRMTWYFS